MKFPSRFRQLTRTVIGVGTSESISPIDLQQLAAREDVLVLAVGIARTAAIDPRLPGEQRGTSLAKLAAAVDGVPRDRLIVTHCG